MSSRANPAARWLQKERAANPKSQPEVSGGGGGDGCGRARGRSVSRFPRGSAPPPPGGRSRWRRGGWAGGPRGAGGARPPRPDPTPSQHLRFRSRRNARCPRVHDPDKLGTRAGATGVASATPGGPCCAGWWGMGGNVASVTGEHPDSPASASPRPAVGTPHPGSREDLLLPRRI